MASKSKAATANNEPTNKGSEVNTKMKITLKHDKPIKSAPRQVSPTENEKLKAIINDLLEKGHIRPSNSPYASSVMLIEVKKKGVFRLLVNYCQLNDATVREIYPPRDIDDYRRRLMYKRLYSRYRIKMDFHLVKMAQESIKYTSFVTTFGQYEFLVMPFGLMNASCFFMKFLNEIFAQMIKDQEIILHMEDILIATQEQDEHLDIMDKMNEVIEHHQLNIRMNKSYGMEDEIEFMGYRINKRGARYTMTFSSDDDEDDDDDSFQF